MSIVYKLTLNKNLSINEIKEFLEEINETMIGIGISISDFNLEDYNINRFEESKEFKYLSGYMNFLKDGKYDDFFMNFRRILEKEYSDLIENYYVQEPQGVILDEDFVKIPKE